MNILHVRLAAGAGRRGRRNKYKSSSDGRRAGPRAMSIVRFSLIFGKK